MLNAGELKIHQQLLRASANFKSSTEAIVVILFAVARSKLFRKLKRRDLVEYIVEDLKIDSTFTFDLSRVVRAGLEHPELERALRERRLTVSKATRILSALKPENVKALIDYAATHTYAETNTFVASGQPEQNCRETWKQLSGDQYKISVILSAKQFENLRRVQSLEAQKQKASKMTDAVGCGLEAYLRRNDPVQKAQRSEARKAKRITLKEDNIKRKSGLNPNGFVVFEPEQVDRLNIASEQVGEDVAGSAAKYTTVSNGENAEENAAKNAIENAAENASENATESVARNLVQNAEKSAEKDNVHGLSSINILNGDQLVRTTKSFTRVRFTAEEKHQVTLKTGGRCCLKDRNGKRCENDRWLDIHHIIPVSRGGTNEIDNLVHVCGPHHDLIHQEVLPLDDEVTWWTFEFVGEDIRERHG